MICEKNENRVTAQNVLGIIIKFIQQHCDVIEKPSEVSALYIYIYKYGQKSWQIRQIIYEQFLVFLQVLLKPDKIEAVLHHFLPCGQVKINA